MREIGEQWVEVIDGKEHMLKAVPLLSIYDGKSMNGSTCHGCSFVDEWDDDCTLENPPCRISEHEAGPYIIKDLGILRNGKVPSSFGVYPTTSAPEDENETWCLYAWVAENGKIIKEEKAWGETEQQAIDAWNRRA